MPPAKSRSMKRKRTRNGCLTCRDRHLKCDENLPVCNNCAKSKRECLRGIRLKFLSTTVHEVARENCQDEQLPVTAFLDQSFATASRYQGGIKTYDKYLTLHTAEELRKAQADFDQCIDINLSMEEPATKRQKVRPKVQARPNSFQFQNLLDDFSKFDPDNLKSEPESMTSNKFNYYEPPVGLDSYLEDVKTRKRSREGSLATSSRSWESNLDDYYIFDSDEEDEIMTSITDMDDAVTFPLTDDDTIEIATSYVSGCRWFLNSITDTVVYDYWINFLIYERGLRGDYLWKEIFQKHKLFSDCNMDDIHEVEKSLEQLKFHMTDEFCSVILTVIVSRYYQRACRNGKYKEVEFFLRKWKSKYYDDPNYDNNATVDICFTAMFGISVLLSIMTDSSPVIDLFNRSHLSGSKILQYKLHALHAAAKSKFESRFEFDDLEDFGSDDSDEDEFSAMDIDDPEDLETISSSKSKTKDLKFTDQTYLVALFVIFNNLRAIIQNSEGLSEKERLLKWNQTLESLHYFESNFPWILSPFFISPLKTQASQGLVTMGLTEDNITIEFAADPPFPNMRCASDLGLITHIVHHSLYLYAEKHKPKGFPSFFDSEDYLSFDFILKYNEIIPYENHKKEREILHMARRVISLFLSHMDVHDSKDEFRRLLEFYGVYFDLAKSFLTDDDVKELNKRL